MNTAKRRIVSLDVFRGIAVAAMIFVNIIPLSEEIPYYLHHAQWIGLYFADLVFPFFLFIVGVSMAYAFASRASLSPARKWGLFILRIAILFLLGLFINWLWNPDDPTVRILGVLQLIALTSLFAAPFARLKPIWIIIISVILIIIHSIILLGVGAPGINPGSLDPNSNIAGWVDMQIIGSNYMYTPTYDPEGIISVISATALVFLGLAVGRTLQIRGGNRKTMIVFFVGGLILILIGLLATYYLPVIKQLWTSSFILIMAGLGMILFSLLYSYLDILNRKSVLLAALPLGRNALFIYVAASIFTVLIQKFIYVFIEGNFMTIYDFLIAYDITFLESMWEKIILALLFVAFWIIIASVLHYKKIYIKL